MHIKGHAIRSITAPGRPSSPTFSSVTDNSITLTWPLTSESDIVSYNIRRSTDGITYEVLITDWPSNSYEDSNLISGQIYYYRVASKNSSNEESEFSIVVSQETTVTGQLTWIQSLPSPIDFEYGIASTFNLDPYIGGTPGSITVETGALPPNVTIVNQTLSYDGGGSASGHTETGVSFTVHTSVDSDWLQRISGAGVVWYHNFDSIDEVNAFRWAGGFGNDPNDLGRTDTVRYCTTDFVSGNGCLEIYRPVGTNDGAVWWRPFSPIQAKSGTILGNGRTTADPGAGSITPRAWNPTSGSSTTANHNQGTYGNAAYQNSNFDGNSFYLQMRVKTSSSRFLAAQPTGGKRIYLSRTEQSLTSQEIVWESKQNPSPYNYFSLYRSGGTPLEGDASNGSQPGNENNSPGPVCSFTGTTTNCWQMQPDTWETYLFYIVPGISGNNDGVVTVWAAHSGETSYTKIWDMSTMLSTYEAGNEKGYNALICSAYMNGQNMTTDFYHRFDEIILSTQTIPCPQV